MLPNSIAESNQKKRILLIHSYHKEYNWTAAIGTAVTSHLIKHAPGKLETKTIYMNTKRNTSERFKKDIGLSIRKFIQKWKPDLIIGSDDNVSKYVISPYFLNGNIPFVFCGLNDDPAIYGFPGTNVTGIRERDLTLSTYNHLRKYAQGKRIGYLTADKYTQKVMALSSEKQLGKKFDKIYFAKDFQDWKKHFLIIQEEVDALLMIDVSSLTDWDNKEAIDFIQKNTKIPTGATSNFSQEYVLLCVAKSAEEHGSWAAKAALKILDGIKPRNIPIATNKEGFLTLNLIVAEKINIVFTPSVLRNAKAVIYAE